ncbi:MAG: hypothetical protein PHQ62_03545 [Clostridia bacterium]|nr:hypothetical protein [Clostridia bacterium]
MKKIKALIVILLFMVTSFTLVACDTNNPPQTTTEYYEIEYQDGSGTHLVKAIKSLSVADIKVFVLETETGFNLYEEWEHSEMLDLRFDKPENATLGWFSGSSEHPNGCICMYYREDFQDSPFGNWLNMRYYVESCSTNIGGFVNVADKNIVIYDRNIIRFNIKPEIGSGTEFKIEALDEDGIVETIDVRIGINLDYESIYWSTITLETDSDFTTIQRSNLPDITIRTENILRKVSV